MDYPRLMLHCVLRKLRCLQKQAARLTDRDCRLAHYFALRFGYLAASGEKSDVIFFSATLISYKVDEISRLSRLVIKIPIWAIGGLGVSCKDDKVSRVSGVVFEIWRGTDRLTDDRPGDRKRRLSHCKCASLIRVLPSGTLPQILDLENLTTERRPSASATVRYKQRQRRSVVDITWRTCTEWGQVWQMRFTTRSAMIVDCWLHSKSSTVYSTMVDWAWRIVALGPNGVSRY